MGNCRFCGQPSGFLKNEHRECRERHDEALDKIVLFFERYLSSGADPQKFKEIVERFREAAHVSHDTAQSAYRDGVSRMAATALDDGTLTVEEESSIAKLIQQFDLEGEGIQEAKITLVKAAVLRDISHNDLRQRFDFDTPPQVAFQKNEKIVWFFSTCILKEMKTTKHYVSGSHGFSFRIMKGISYRVGTTKGRTVSTTDLQEKGNGNLILTDKNVYFSSSTKSFRIPLRKIISVEAFSDAIVLMKEPNSQAVFLYVDDTRFAANVILQLSSL
jgi:hypothetical protein